MKKIAILAMVAFSITLSAQAAKKDQPVDSYTESDACPSYGCNEGGVDGQYSGDDQSSMDTIAPGSENYEGNDRDTGSDYINGMPY